MSKRVPKILDACCRTLLALGLAGCGQKGPLYLPAPAAATASAASAPAPRASAPAAPLPLPPASR
ncbi:LPS translocon maturation chaperone LptM [Caldimonas tepidiphila]|uniref:LPS translocon maturation chaperone LptM n=1 Tax=Caldimonas tepidiphila TaxID=2315841 RepID=UPI000E5BF915